MLMPSIDKAAAEKGIREVDEELAPAFAMRKSSREKTGRPYYDTSVMQATRYGHPLLECYGHAYAALID